MLGWHCHLEGALYLSGFEKENINNFKFTKGAEHKEE
jgi:hypothetical protein